MMLTMLHRYCGSFLMFIMCKWFLVMFVGVVYADVLVISSSSNFTVNMFPDLPASFGKVLPYDGIEGCAVVANPPHACEAIDPPPSNVNCSEKWFVLIRRFECSFVDKVRAAQNANFDAAIIYNVGSNLIEPMAGEDADDITISAIFIGQDDGLKIQSLYQYDEGYMLLLTNELPFNINSYLLPFAIVVAICFAIMLVFMLVKCIKDRRRLRRYRLPSSSLKTIPTSKFNKGDPYDTCAICLEDYIEGDKLRILPCSHAYHAKCIDPWLTRNRRVCPVCKRRVIARGEQLSDSDSETEDETRSLLRPGTYSSSGGTFDNQTEQSANNRLTYQSYTTDEPSHEEETMNSTRSIVVPSDSLVIENRESSLRNAPQDLRVDLGVDISSVFTSSYSETETLQDSDANADSSVNLTSQSLLSDRTLDV